MNAHVERFNRTIQEESIGYYEELRLDSDQFNRQLIRWFLWYNAGRPHRALPLDSFALLFQAVYTCAQMPSIRQKLKNFLTLICRHV